MKKYVFTLFFAFLSIVASAQYKKASFLNKSGRTHELGATAHLLSGGRSMAPGIFYSYGRDKSANRLFHWFDLELILPYKFKYTTTDFDMATPIKVSGKTSMSLAYRYNLACYLLDNTNEENKVLPFVTGGANMILFGGGAKTIDMEYDGGSNPKDFLTTNNFSVGANIGGGVVYNITEKIGVKGVVGYNFQYNLDGTDTYEDQGYKIFDLYNNHPYVSFGIRFKMAED